MEIIDLKIYTQNFNEQIDFYSNTLELEIISSSSTHAIFKIGKSRLHFIQSQKSYPYHFAINVSGNKINKALSWLKERVEVLTFENIEIQDFRNWNAEAIYFYDKDKNIVEFIVRKNLDYQSTSHFSNESLKEISEIGIPVINIEDTFTKLHYVSDLNMFDGDFNKFCAIGDEKGLFICINKKTKKWFPTNDKAFSADFSIKFKHNNKGYNLAFNDGFFQNIITR